MNTAAPLTPGWLVVYPSQIRDGNGHLPLCGGCDDRLHGTVQDCAWDGTAWIVVLTDGQRLPLWRILSVAKTDERGHVLSAWTVREHGFDGKEG